MKQIRGHHLFCMALFSGHGYDKAFSRNMAEIIEGLKGGEAFRLCMENDSICGACPNRKEGEGCQLGTEDVFQKDSAALNVLGFQPGEICGWVQAMEQLRLVSREGFHNVCGECRWKKEQLCTYELLRERVFQETEGLGAKP